MTILIHVIKSMNRLSPIHAVLLLSLIAVSCDVGEWKRAAVISEVASLHSALVHKTNTLTTADANWRVVTEAEYDRCVRQFLDAGFIDTGGKRPAKSETLRDRWGNRLHIAIRKNHEGTFEYIVWSNGKDGVSGTADDIISPSDAKPPHK